MKMSDDYFTCRQCGSTEVIADKSWWCRASCANGHSWFKCKHGVRHEGVCRLPCQCQLKMKAKREALEAKVYVHRKKDRNPSKKLMK